MGFPPEDVSRLANYLRSVRDVPPVPPRALLVVSAHWEAPVPTVMTAEHPPMLYDYYGFPPESYTITRRRARPRSRHAPARCSRPPASPPPPTRPGATTTARSCP